MTRKAKITTKVRSQVLTRDNHICRACGFGGSSVYAPFLDCDHAIAESAGGETSVDNLQCLCKACNAAKGARSWSFAIRVASATESDWAFNQRVIGVAFASEKDTAKRLRKLKN